MSSRDTIARSDRAVIAPRWRAAALALAVVLGACTPPDRTPRVVLHPASGQPVPVRVEVADTPESRGRGLMYRNDLAEDQGMIFFFEKDSDYGFWMKNTPLSLDMIFISADGSIVGIAADTVPFSLKSVQVGTPSRAVLEVRGGFAKRHGIAAGDRVTYENVTSSLLP